jgi:hypothetical protein
MTSPQGSHRIPSSLRLCQIHHRIHPTTSIEDVVPRNDEVPMTGLIRRILGRRRKAGRFRQRTFRLGPSSLNLDKANRLAGELEDEEIIKKLRLGK